MQHVKKTTTKITENIPAKVGGKWGTNEICFPTDKGGLCMADVMDAASKFMLTNETYPEANLQIYDATDMFGQAVRIAKEGTRRAHKPHAGLL